MAVKDVDVGRVLKVLKQKCDDLDGKPTLWSGKTETASRVRGRIEVILDWAKVRKYRSGENPARWRGNLEPTLPKRNDVQKVTPTMQLCLTVRWVHLWQRFGRRKERLLALLSSSS
jgi:hypothetical protein